MTKQAYDIDPALRLRQAANQGDLEEVKQTRELDKIIKLSGSTSGQTALHRAAINNKIEVVEFLVSKGADTSIKDKFGKTAAEVAKGKSKNFLSNLELAKKAIFFSKSLASEPSYGFNSQRAETLNNINTATGEEYKKFLDQLPKIKLTDENQKRMFRHQSKEIIQLNFLSKLSEHADKHKVRDSCQERSLIAAAYFIANSTEEVNLDILQIRHKADRNKSHQLIIIHKEGQETDLSKIAKSETALFLDPYQSGEYYTSSSIPKESCASEIFDKNSRYDFSIQKIVDLSKKNQSEGFLLQNEFSKEKSRLLEELKEKVSKIDNNIEKSASNTNDVRKAHASARFR